MIGQTARPPSKPDRPIAKEFDDTEVHLKWSKPEDDGGAEITGYVIKYGKRIIGLFPSYSTVPVAGNTTFFTFTDQLKRNTTYQFAVAAVNTAGQGEFSDLSDYIRTGDGK